MSHKKCCNKCTAAAAIFRVSVHVYMLDFDAARYNIERNRRLKTFQATERYKIYRTTEEEDKDDMRRTNKQTETDTTSLN